MRKHIYQFLLTLGFLTVTVLLNAQCSTDRHSNHPSDSWQSCSASLLPDGSTETGHWIMYDLGAEYFITDLHYWNYNVFGSTENGFQNVEIRTSLDFSTWESAGSYTLEQAQANNQYLGEDLELTGFAARYVLLLAQSNYGGDCYGISEIRFNLGTAPPISGIEDEGTNLGLRLYPNPNNGHFRVDLRGSTGTHLNVIDLFGRIVFSQSIDEADVLSIRLKDRPVGTYFVQLIDGTFVRTEKILIK